MNLNRSNLTKRDLAILETLALRVRVLTVDQIARTWFRATSDPVRQADHRLRTLTERGLIERFTVFARPELKMDAPAAAWRPGAAPPDFGKLSHLLVQRWTEPIKATPLVIVSQPAGNWLGGTGGRRPRRSEVSHDITLGGVYLRWLGLRCRPGDNWISEARLRGLGYGGRASLPDAMVESGGRRLVIEVGGEYPARKLASFHAFCQKERLPYEIW